MSGRHSLVRRGLGITIFLAVVKSGAGWHTVAPRLEYLRFLQPDVTHTIGSRRSLSLCCPQAMRRPLRSLAFPDASSPSPNGRGRHGAGMRVRSRTPPPEWERQEATVAWSMPSEDHLSRLEKEQVGGQYSCTAQFSRVHETPALGRAHHVWPDQMTCSSQ